MTLPRPFLELLPYISSHNPKDNMAYKAIIQILTLLTVNPMMKQILRTHNFIDCKSNQTGCETISNDNVKVKNCKWPNWRSWPNLLKGSEFYSEQGQRYKIKTEFICAPENLIYVVTYSGCSHKYTDCLSTLHNERIRFLRYKQIPLNEHRKMCMESPAKLQIFHYHQRPRNNFCTTTVK